MDWAKYLEQNIGMMLIDNYEKAYKGGMGIHLYDVGSIRLSSYIY